MKILASDFDNTLYFKNGFKDKDLKAIKNFQNQGHKFGICTGRSIDGVLTPSEDYIDYDFYIVLSGGMILDKDQNILFKKMIPLSIIKEIYNKFKINISVVDDDKMFLLYNVNDAFKVKMKQQLKKVMNKKIENMPFISSLDEINSTDVNSFSFHFPSNGQIEAQSCADYLNEHYSKYLNAFVNNVHVDVCAKGCSKGEALLFIKDYYNNNHISGIGDSFNDLPMIEKADTSFTFTYAPEKVKKTSDFIVNHLDECIDILLREIE